MSERTKKIREAMEDGTIVHRYPLIKALCDDHERLEAKHVRICFEHTILRQRVERLEGLLKRWGAKDGQDVMAAEVELMAEAARLAKEKP